MVSSIGYVVLSGKMHVERQETTFLTCPKYSCQSYLFRSVQMEVTNIQLMGGLENVQVDESIVTVKVEFILHVLEETTNESCVCML